MSNIKSQLDQQLDIVKILVEQELHNNKKVETTISTKDESLNTKTLSYKNSGLDSFTKREITKAELSLREKIFKTLILIFNEVNIKNDSTTINLKEKTLLLGEFSLNKSTLKILDTLKQKGYDSISIDGILNVKENE